MKNLTPKGFTLIETLVAIAVLTITLVGPLSTANIALQASRTSQDQLTASYLAEEGIEFVHSRHDDNFTPDIHVHGFPGPYLDECVDGIVCSIDVLNRTMTPCDSNQCTPLYLDANNHYSQDSAGTPTIFTRSVSLSHSGDILFVSVVVSWTEGGNTHSVTLQDTLQNYSSL